MKKLIFVLIVLFLAQSVSAATDNITQLVFTTPTRTVVPGAVSEILTVQTQNAGGVSEKISSTADVSFVSSSATGQFVNDSGSPVSTTMNTNSSNRNFYYRDSAVGVHLLTITVTIRGGGPSWAATQSITIGSGGAPPDDGGTATSTGSQNTGSTGAGSSSSSSSGGDISTHSSSASLSTLTDKPDFAVSAGRKRLAAMGSPVSFRATLSGLDPSGGVEMTWSFGDGTQALGLEPNHVYALPGNYEVVLNARQGGNQAVARTSVEVVKPEVVIARATSEVIELANQSRREVNPGGWRLTLGNQFFVLPGDTIIAGNGKLPLPSTVTRLAPSDSTLVQLSYPDGRPANPAGNLAMTPVSTPKPDLAKVLNELSSALNHRQTTLVTKSASAPTPTMPETKNEQLATVVVGAPKSAGWWDKIYDLFR